MTGKYLPESAAPAAANRLDAEMMKNFTQAGESDLRASASGGLRDRLRA